MTPLLFNRRPFPVLLAHWAAWIIIYSLSYLPTALNAPRINWTLFYQQYLGLSSVNFFLFYVVAFYLLRGLGMQKTRWIWLAISCIVLVILFTYLKFRLYTYFTGQALYNNINAPEFLKQRWHKETTKPLGIFSYHFRSYFQANLFYSFSIVVVAIAYRSVIAWYLQEKSRRELENQKLKAELAFLESQINPHFLFNALNNIYALSVQENSKLTGNSLLKLSDLLRYMLYEKEEAGDLVPLDKEILHINNYIDLEKIRHRGPIHIDFSIQGEINGKMVVPLLIFPLIENACKHGILTDAKSPVTILLNVTEDRLEFSLANYCNNYQKDKAGGIGVQNVKKRLELIYGAQHSFQEIKTGNRYTVNLNIPL
ncbi:hypothetical protein A4D02_26650 [Niastella koreensis]|uniref:Signal transduction histidine kinase internal region domain-containing protein n=2 Tax=Niastella koreensis TaxID=354356 RepID=A0ABX3NYP9_9BACT|nr:histidine kinase [Niastella koreensis]AEV99420.1 putative signal transduction histidine kinase [Niastella koreensis GR20-10]OQP50022.1 hypothetical protein A4D02_26650 [Niastella koreensis]